MNPQMVTFFHSPQTRSGGTLALFEELGVPYDLRVINMKAGEQRQPEYLAINPMGKVPAIRHGDALVTEQPAVFIYLASTPRPGWLPRWATRCAVRICAGWFFTAHASSPRSLTGPCSASQPRWPPRPTAPLTPC